LNKVLNKKCVTLTGCCEGTIGLQVKHQPIDNWKISAHLHLQN